MKKTPFLIVTALAVLFLVSTLVRYGLASDIAAKRTELLKAQGEIRQGQQSEQVLRRMIIRIAQGSKREADLGDLLKQFNIKVGPGPAASTHPAPAPAPTGQPAPKPVPAPVPSN